MTGWQTSSLADRLASVLSTDCDFQVHHVSTPPTPCTAIYSPLPSKQPQRTFCENQFLSVSVLSDGQQIQVFGLEILIYTTKQLTTLFVSKADSTGYLYLLNLPKGTSSPLRTICSTFLKYLIDNRQRAGKRLVVSLFARAQNQYLFPGSIENSHKHVLDDRRLIKWWCQVLDAVLSLFTNPPLSQHEAEEGSRGDSDGVLSRGYLRVPGCDRYETASFYPKHAQDVSSSGSPRWSATDPLRLLGRDPAAPERCLVPRFPDDPLKSGQSWRRRAMEECQKLGTILGLDVVQTGVLCWTTSRLHLGCLRSTRFGLHAVPTERLSLTRALT